MNAAVAFNAVAESYDGVFSESPIGRAQRGAVWSKAAEVFRSGGRILELNCGTGEDARYLATLGAEVLALDGSEAMVAVARKKCAGVTKIDVEVLANEALSELRAEAAFDGVFSNFSGLNCVADLAAVARQLARVTRPGANALLCFSTRFCAWETLWYGAHFDRKRAARRWQHPCAMANVGGKQIAVYYPRVSQIRKVFAPQFEFVSAQAIGLFVPPSYLNGHAAKHPRLLRAAVKLDRAFSRMAMLRGIGDHVLLHFQRTKDGQ